VNHCVESDDNIDLKIEVPRLMAAQGDSRAWKSISAKLSSLNRLFSGPNKWDVKIHGSGALALDQELKTAIVAARKSIEAAETASNTNGELSAAATERPASRKRSRGDDGEGRLVSAPRKLRKTAVTRPEEMERLVEQENTAACEPKKEAGEVDRDATQVSSQS
jgi:hypothetical protein